METKIEVKCPQCGSGYVIDGKRCRKCGHTGDRQEFVKRVVVLKKKKPTSRDF